MTVSTVFMIVAAVTCSNSPLQVSAQLSASELQPGGHYEVVVSYTLADGVKAGNIQSPILQIATPQEVELAGDVLTRHRDLARNEFLQAPFELLLDSNPTAVPFKLLAPPSDGAAFYFNVLAYVEQGGTGHFVRQRLKLPVAAGAAAGEVAPQPSTWGRDGTLQLGDKAVDFELPAADGSTVKLGDHLGKHRILVTTYRAHW